MKNLLVILGLVIATAIPGWTADEDVADPRELGRKLLTRIEQLHAQYVAIDGMIGDGRPYKGLAAKPIQSALTLLAGSTEANDIDFLAALTDCRAMEPALNLETTTLGTLLHAKGENIDAIVRFIESMGVNIAELREEAQAERLAAAAKAMDAAPSQAEVFGGDFFANPNLGNYLHLYLTLSNVPEFFETQSRLSANYGWGEISRDQRFPALFSVCGKTYQGDAKYLWRNFIELVAHRFALGDTNESKVDPYLKQFRYQDTWAINGHLTTTHHKRTHDAFSYLSSQPGTIAVNRLLRGLGIK